jgi:SAM-dependent methyltransferase
MNRDDLARWEERHRGAAPGSPEPSLVEMLPLLPRGLVLDVAAGTGRNSIEMSRNGFTVVAVDFSPTAMRSLAAAARSESLSIMPLVADLETSLPFRTNVFDTIINISYLDHGLIPSLKQALRPGGFLLFDTFLINQAESGHPRDPRFLLKHYELYDLLADMELIRYREGIVAYPNGARAWRAAALARRVNP